MFAADDKCCFTDRICSAHRGKVKWFNASRGYGFLAPADGAEDVLIHISTLDQGKIVELNEGLDVHYEARSGPQGMQATRIVLP